jgi:large repetitive protein
VLRPNVLVVLCLGVLASCTPAGQESPQPEGLEVRQPLVESTASFSKNGLTWTGSNASCVTCGQPSSDFAFCSDKPGWEDGVSFDDPLPPGSVLVKIEASVYGLLTGGNSQKSTQVQAFMNDADAGPAFGFFDAGVTTGCSSSNKKSCVVSKATSSYRFSGFSSTQYNYGGTNTLKLSLPSSADYKYCASYVDLKLFYANPKIAVSRNTLEFGKQKIGADGGKTGQLNVYADPDSGVDLKVNDCTIDAPDGGTGPFDVVNSNSCVDIIPTQISPLTIQVRFRPTAAGKMNGTLLIDSNDPVTPAREVELIGEGVESAIDVRNVPDGGLSFPDRTVGASAVLRVDLNNVSSEALNVAPSIMGDGGSSFSVDAGPIPVSGDGGSLWVTFTPQDGGVANASLVLNAANQPGDPGVEIPLAGLGVSPKRVMDAGSLDFQTVQVSVPKTLPLSVGKAGTGTLRISNVSISSGSGEYFVAVDGGSDGGVYELQDGGVLNMDVRFTPSGKNNRLGTLSFQTNEEGSPTVNVPLLGKGATYLTTTFDGGTLNFGQISKGDAGVITVTLQNLSSVPITVTPPTFSQPQFSFVMNPLQVPQGSKTFQVRFTPTDSQPVQDTLTLLSDADSDPLEWELRGQGRAARAHLSRPPSDAGVSEHDFGPVRWGSTGRTVKQTFRLSNVGTDPLTIGTPAITGNSSVFTYLGTSGITIPAGSYADFDVSFAPAAELSYNGELSIPSNAENTPTKLLLKGKGDTANLTVSRSTIPFGDIKVGTESPKVSVVISNSGLADALVEGIPESTGFKVTCDGGACAYPQAVSSGKPFTFQVFFAPLSPGQVDGGQINIDNDLNAPLKVNLTGKGTVGVMNVLQDELSFGTQVVGGDGGIQTFTITNEGTATLEISNIGFLKERLFQISPADAGPSDGHPLVILGGTSKTLKVLFVPQDVGVISDNNGMTINSDAFQDPSDTVKLVGEGIDGDLVMVDAGTISFSNVQVGKSGTRSVTLRNDGKNRVVITGVQQSSNPAFKVTGLDQVSDGGVLVLNPSETRVFPVSFVPTVRGYDLTSATLRTDAVVKKNLTLVMDGTGVSAAMGALPAKLDFSNANVGASVFKDFSITNVGELDLNVFDIVIEAVGAPDGGPAADAGDDHLAFEMDRSDGGTPFIVSDGGTASVRLKFSPLKVKPYEAQAVIQANVKNGSEDWKIRLEGDGTSPKMQLSPDGGLLDCGSTPVDQPSAPVSLTIANASDSSGPLSAKISLAGADRTFFKTSSTDLGELLPGASNVVTVWLEPNGQERSFSAQLVISSNDLSQPEVKVLLVGRGGLSQIDTPARLDFGQQLLRSASVPRRISIINNNTSPISLSDISLQGAGSSQFVIVSRLPRYPHTLDAVSAKPADGGVGTNQLDLDLAFTPLSETPMPAQVKISFNFPRTERIVELLGQGIPSVLAVSPPSLEFEVVRAGKQNAARTKTLNVLNVSSDTITLDTLDVQRVTGEPFSVDTVWPDGGVLEPNKSLSLNVTYNPRSVTESETNLVFSTKVPAQPQAASARVTGSATNLVLRAEPESLDFGRVDMSGAPPEPKPVTVTNASSSALLVNVSLLDPAQTAFHLDTKALLKAIPPGESAVFTVAFIPTSVEPAETKLEVRVEGEAETEAQIRVSGQGRTLTGQGGGCSLGSTEAGSAGILVLLAWVLWSSRRRHG